MAGRIAGQGMNWIKPAKRLALYARDGFACVYCGATAEGGAKLGLDHVLACELGGTNEATNLVTCCGACNSAKQDLSLSDWLQRLTDKGIDTEAVPARIRKQTAATYDMTEGRRLLALRKAARSSE